MTSFLSIIIPAYKEEKNLPKLLKSIFSSTFADFEVIVGDDGSPVPLENSVGPKFVTQKNLRWVRLEKNRGPAAARNEAAKLAKGEILVFFDADVTLYPDTLEKIASYFKKDPDLHALTGVWDKEQKRKSLFPQYKALRDWSYWTNERNRGEYYYLFSTRVAAIKRAIFERLGGFNESFRQMEDVELTYRIAYRYAIIFCPDVRVHHEFEGFWTIARKYFWRSFYWSKLYSKRRKFDPVATTFWEMLTALYGISSLPLIFLSLFFKPFLILGLGFFLAHLFFLRKFLGFVFKEKGFFFTLYSISAGLSLYYFIAAGAFWSFVCSQKERSRLLKLLRGLRKLRLTDNLICLCLFSLVFFVGSILSPDYGISWDEPDNIFSGGVYLNFLTHGFDREYVKTNLQSSSFFGDKIFPLDRELSHLPPLANILASILTYFLTDKLGLLNEIICFHIASVFFLSLAVAFVFLFARILSLSKLVSIFTGLSLWLYPHFFGHGHSNIKEIGQAALFLASLYFLTKAVFKSKLSCVFWGAVFFGFAFDTKFNAVYIPLIWNLWLLIGIVSRKFKINWQWFLKANLILILVGGATIYLCWPFLWDKPWLRMVEVVRYFTTVGRGYFFFFNGKIYQAGVDYLWYYPWIFYLIVTPPEILGLGLIGGFEVVREFIKEKKFELTLLFIWFLPLFRAFLPQANVYDGIRHFLEVSPAILLLSGFGLRVMQKFAERYSLPGIILPMLIFLILAHLAWSNLALHPYQTAYYNFLVGGVKGASDRFDIELEGLSAKEAMEILHQEKGPVRVYFPILGHLAIYYFLPGDQLVQNLTADFVVLANKKSHLEHQSLRKLSQQIEKEYTIYKEVKRNEAVMVTIYERK